MLNDDGAVVRVVHGPVPLWGARRGEDVMMTDVLAFDLRVFDPGAPLFATRKAPDDPTSSDRRRADAERSGLDERVYWHDDNMQRTTCGSANGIGTITTFPFVGQGAYVDMGYGYDQLDDVRRQHLLDPPTLRRSFASAASPWFFAAARR